MKQLLSKIASVYAGRLIGVGVGLLLGILLLCIGFWRFLLLALFMAGGWIVGSRLDQDEKIAAWLSDAADRLFGRWKDD